MIKLKSKVRRTVNDVDHMAKISLQHKDEYIVEVKGLDFWVHPQVLTPKYSKSALFYVDHWDVKKGMSVLDVGTGSGIMIMFAALAGAQNCIALDINKYACDVAKRNMKLNKVDGRVKVIQSDVYDALKDEKFDRIVFNAPFWDRKADPDFPLMFAFFDEGYKSTKRFLKEGSEYLNPNGKILLGFAGQDDVGLMEKHIKDANLKIEKKIEKTEGHSRILYYLIPKKKVIKNG
jgi:release factor glutamine methyltransferase